jgi:D-alanyl-D-alanine carboxypeptidase
MRNRIETSRGSFLRGRITLLAAIGMLAWVPLAAPGAPVGTPSGPAQANEVKFPATPAGRAAEAYFQAFNEGESAMKAFFEKYAAKSFLERVPSSTRLERYGQMRGQIGTLAPQAVLDAKPDAISVSARAKGGAVFTLSFEFEASEPFGLLGIRILAGGAGPGEDRPAPEPKKDDAELFAAVRAYAAKAVEAGDFSGVILIARNGIPVFDEAFGYADRDRKIPNRTDTKFNVGSIDKSFTSLAVRQLAAEGKLSLDDAIGKFLPDYPNKDAASKVTVRHLLDMSSGIGDFFGERFDAADKEKIRSLADYLPLFADQPLAFEPGQGNQYSNGGYIVLGLIIQKVSGQDYYSYIRDHVFKPAGMNDSEWTRKDAEVPNRAVGYVREGSAWKTNYGTLPGIGSSAGGGYSTAGDLLKYTIALEKGLYGPAGEDKKGGLGIAGGAPGINAGVEWMPERGVTIIVMANLSPPAATRAVRQIRAWLPR